MNRLKRQVEDLGWWLLDCPRALLIIIGIGILLMFGAQIGMLKERWKIETDTIRTEIDLRQDIIKARIREATCLRAFKDKTEYQFHNDRLVVKAALGLNEVYDYGPVEVAEAPHE